MLYECQLLDCLLFVQRDLSIKSSALYLLLKLPYFKLSHDNVAGLIAADDDDGIVSDAVDISAIALNSMVKILIYVAMIDLLRVQFCLVCSFELS